MRSLFEKQIEKMTFELAVSKAASKSERGKCYGRSSQRNARSKGEDKDDNRPSSKKDYISPDDEQSKDAKSVVDNDAKESVRSLGSSTLDLKKLQQKFNRRYLGTEEEKRFSYSWKSIWSSSQGTDMQYIRYMIVILKKPKRC